MGRASCGGGHLRLWQGIVGGSRVRRGFSDFALRYAFVGSEIEPLWLVVGGRLSYGELLHCRGSGR
jgi:hypothetical protein